MIHQAEDLSHGATDMKLLCMIEFSVEHCRADPY
jgi:hypothetical protein